MAETHVDGPVLRHDAEPMPNPNDLPEHLPPVEPPSAGFIVQLFVVPALIVVAIVGVWALFGKLAAEDADITQVLANLRSTNEHRRGPSMLRLAQLLQLDARREPAEQQYVANAQIATETAALLSHWMSMSPRNSDQQVDVLETQIFLARTLGWFSTPDPVLPVLQQAAAIEMEPKSEQEEAQVVRELQLDLRKGAIASVASVVDRAGRDEAQRIAEERPELVETLIDASAQPDEEPVIRQLGAFALGMFPAERAREQLRALLIHADEKTRLNAAIALARSDLPDGYGVFEATLRDASEPPPKSLSVEEQGTRDFEQYVALRNAIRAAGELSDRFEPPQRERLVELLRPIAERHKLHEIRQAADEAAEKLANG